MSYHELNMDGVAFLRPEAVVPPPSQGCTASSEWSHVRHLIKHLYVDENHTLKDVMTIMARNHGHRGTTKMYKNRIKKWGLDKKTKEAEAMAILRMKLRRDAAGKDSSFRVRGKTMTIDDVLRYLKRKGILNPEAVVQLPQASTPPALECWTPIASPTMLFATMQTSAEDDKMGYKMQEFANGKMRVGPLSMARDSGSGNDDTHPYLSVEQIRSILFSSPKISSFEIPRSPLPPQSLIVLEKLFASIKAYYGGACESGLFITGGSGYLLNVNRSIADSGTVEFDDLCRVGVAQMDGKLFFEGRRYFSKAFGLVPRLIQQQDPVTMDTILRALIFLKVSGYSELVNILRNWAGDVAAVLFPIEHPWRQIFSQITALDNTHFELGIVEAERCVCDMLGNKIGRFHLTTISCQRKSSLMKSAKSLRNLLIEAEQELEQRNSGLLQIKLWYASCLCDEGQPFHAKVMLEEVLNCCQGMEDEVGTAIDSLGVLSYCEYKMGDEDEAESRIRDAIRRSDAVLGKFDSTGLVFRQCLEGWLCEWGREDESAALKAEIEEILGPDDVELEDVNFEKF